MFSFDNSTLVAKTREPKNNQLCIAVLIIQNIGDADPLDS